MVDGAPKRSELDEFLADLRRLREQAGQPSLRAMARSTHYSHTALAGVLSGGRLPSLALTLAFVRACEGDEDEWRRRWNRVHASLGEAGQDGGGQDGGGQDGGGQDGAGQDGAGQDGAGQDGAGQDGAGQDRAGHDGAAPESRRRGVRGRPLAVGLVALTAALAALAGTMLSMGPGPARVVSAIGTPTLTASAMSCPRRPDPGDAPLVQCDDSRFVADVTIPDGTTVRAGQRFLKTWEIQNTGLVAWRGRFLTRQGLLAGQGLCGSVPRVPIPTTMPGQDVNISVMFTAPSLPGSCRVDWKMTDPDGRLYFPFLGGLYVTVNVTG